MSSIFLLSPAHSGGVRAQMLVREAASFDLAMKLKRGEATLGEVFSFLSGLYFRGKQAYADAFARGPADVLVITTNAGLVRSDTVVTREMLLAYGGTDIHTRDPRFTEPLARDAKKLLKRAKDKRIVLLGSIASNKYVDTLTSVLGERLLFPTDFVGRGDMSRGGLLLRCVDAGEELPYAPVLGAVRHGKPPPRLAPRKRQGAE